MKKAAAIGIVSAAAAGFALPASAQTSMNGFYVGATVGQATAKDWCNGLGGTGASCDDSANAWKIFGGYQINRNFAAELGYANLGKVTASLGSLTDEAKATAWELSAIGAWPIADRFAVFGRLGAYRAELKEDTNFAGNFSNTNTDLTYGFGVRYEVTANFGLRAEWQRYSKVGGGDLDKSDVDVLGITALWNF
jgi:OOP family OmpA-OmpF porin